MENGEWRIIKNTPTRMDFNSQFSIQLVVCVLPTHRCVGCGSILRSRDHIVAFVPEDLERFIEDRSQLRKDWAATNPATFVVLDLWLGDAHPVQLPIDVFPS